jgi:hypothetical protein
MFEVIHHACLFAVWLDPGKITTGHYEFAARPRFFEPRLGLADVLGVAERRAGNRYRDMPEPDRRRALARKPDARR